MLNQLFAFWKSGRSDLVMDTAAPVATTLPWMLDELQSALMPQTATAGATGFERALPLLLFANVAWRFSVGHRDLSLGALLPGAQWKPHNVDCGARLGDLHVAVAEPTDARARFLKVPGSSTTSGQVLQSFAGLPEGALWMEQDKLDAPGVESAGPHVVVGPNGARRTLLWTMKFRKASSNETPGTAARHAVRLISKHLGKDALQQFYIVVATAQDFATLQKEADLPTGCIYLPAETTHQMLRPFGGTYLEAWFASLSQPKGNIVAGPQPEMRQLRRKATPTAAQASLACLKSPRRMGRPRAATDSGAAVGVGSENETNGEAATAAAPETWVSSV
eukprot:m.159916 g.159916  ORF g.159916 m.159916 type:complete len:335 (-) comp17613_c0_seq12:106-1110(-)